MDKNKQPRKINITGANIVPTPNKANIKNNSTTFKHTTSAYDYDNPYQNSAQNYAVQQKQKRQINVDEFALNEQMLKNNSEGFNYSTNINTANSATPRGNLNMNANATPPQNTQRQNTQSVRNINVNSNVVFNGKSLAPQNNMRANSLNNNSASTNVNLPNTANGAILAVNSGTAQSTVLPGSKAVSGGTAQNTVLSGSKRPAKKKKGLNFLLNFVSIACAVFLVVYVGLQTYAGSIINTGVFGTVSKTYQTPPEYANNELNLLVLGIDYTSEDGQGRSENGNTDVIMYVRFNFADNTIRMLQIPRDVYVGEEVDHGGTGKINAVYAGADEDKDRVNSLAYVLYEQYKLPVDNYVSIDMDSLREIVDMFGGVEVYIEQDMYFEGSSLNQGWQVLDGAAAEFFVRYRNYPTGDIERLGNQRNFYSALFSMVRSVTWQEIVRLTPIVQQYINTDLSTTDCAALAIELLSVPSSSILLAILPVSDAVEPYYDNSGNPLYISVADVDTTADMLNEYFRAEGAEVPAEELAIAQLPKSATLYNTNVQWMAEVDENTGIEAGQAADETVTGENILDEVAQEEQQEQEAAAAAAQAAE